jgi:hypothetical protein
MNLILKEKGVYARLQSFINGLAWAFGPLLGGYLIETADINVSAILSSILIIIGFLIINRVLERLEEPLVKL